MPDTQDRRPRRTAESTERRRKRYSPLPFIAVCAVVILALSLLFRVGSIEVTGGSGVYTDDEIIAASGIQEGDSLFFINKSDAVSGIYSRLPAIDYASVEIALPNRIVITIEETNSIAYVDLNGEIWSVDRSMRFIERVSDADTAGMIEIRGLAAEAAIAGTDIDAEKSPWLTDLVDAMTSTGVLRSVTWIDVSESGIVEFDCLGRFTVRMRTDADLTYEMQKLVSAVSQLGENDRALLDLTIDDKVHYIPR